MQAVVAQGWQCCMQGAFPGLGLVPMQVLQFAVCAGVNITDGCGCSCARQLMQQQHAEQHSSTHVTIHGMNHVMVCGCMHFCRGCACQSAWFNVLLQGLLYQAAGKPSATADNVTFMSGSPKDTILQRLLLSRLCPALTA